MVRSAVHPVLISLVLTLCFNFTAAAQKSTAGSSDAHLGPDPARLLYLRSAFAHGYIHGYEEGYHTGNLDAQLGRPWQPLDHFKQYRKISGYESSFGDRDSFSHGYQEGFRAAYEDAVNDGVFRAVARVRRASSGLGGDPAPNREFDKGFADGYEAGLRRGQQPNMPGKFQNAAEHCGVNGHSAAFCDAFSRAYGIGFGDGSLLLKVPRTQTAQIQQP